VIQLPDLSPFQAAERYAIELLVDLSRLVPVGAAELPVLTLEIVQDGAGATARPVQEWIMRGWGIEAGEGTVRVPRSALPTVTAIAGVVAEQETRAADRYGRVPPDQNALVAAGLERTPVISLAGRTLGDVARRAAGRRPVRFLAPWPDGRRWAVALTHDLDVVRWWPVFTLLRLSELLRRGEWSQVARVVGAIPGGLLGRPVAEALTGLIAAERSRRLRSSWFVLCGTPTPATMRAGDLTYHPESRLARALLAAMVDAGDEIGLHGSFETYVSTDAFTRQRGRLSGLLARPVSGVRQHFLRLRPGATQRAMAQSGFTYDASIGFPDRNGFRQGLADVAPVWDHEQGRALAIDEVPVMWMDRALSKYRGNENPDAWVADGLDLADACRGVEGLWTGVWHPNLVPALGFPGAPEAYARLLDALLDREPYVGTVSELVAWRRTRRMARVDRLGADGVVRAMSGATPALLEPA
jgi:hypothetical protein